MNIEYVGRNLQVDDKTREFAEGKLSKVTKFLEDPIEIRVTLETEKHRQIAELHVAHRHGVLQATEENNSMLDALNLVVDKVEKQARRAKDKFRARRRRSDRAVQVGHQWPVDVIERETVAAGSTPRVIKKSYFRIKPMSIEEAALELEGSKNEFVVFLEAASDRVSVLYRRKDNNYGLITPEI